MCARLKYLWRVYMIYLSHVRVTSDPDKKWHCGDVTCTTALSPSFLKWPGAPGLSIGTPLLSGALPQGHVYLVPSTRPHRGHRLSRRCECLTREEERGGLGGRGVWEESPTHDGGGGSSSQPPNPAGSSAGPSPPSSRRPTAHASPPIERNSSRFSEF